MAVRRVNDSPQWENPKNEVYNPITNPIPWVNQNPYIQQERSVLGTEGPNVNQSIRTFRRSVVLGQNAEMNILG